MVSHCGGGLQPLRGARGHPLARRRHARRHRAVLLREGPRERARLVGGAPAGVRAGRLVPRATSRPIASPSTAPTATSRRAPRSPSCPRTRPRCGASRVTNNGDEPREIELTSYGEIVLAPPDADRAHPAFAQPVRRDRVARLVYARSPPRAGRARRRSSRSGACTWWTPASERVGAGDLRDRSRALPRPRSLHPRSGRARGRRRRCRARTGAVLDPIFALRTRVRLEPGQSASVAFTTLVADQRASAPSSWPTATTIRTPRSARSTWRGPRRRSSCASSASRRRDAAVFQELAGHLLLRRARRSARRRRSCARNRGSQPLLWAHRRLGRLADPARDHRLGRRTADAAAAARGAPLLAPARA